MEPDTPKNDRWEGIKQYSIGYGVLTGITMLFVYFAMPQEGQNAGEVVGYIWGGSVVILLVPGFFAWLGKTDTPRRRFVLFLALWFIMMALVTIGIITA